MVFFPQEENILDTFCSAQENNMLVLVLGRAGVGGGGTDGLGWSAREDRAT